MEPATEPLQERIFSGIAASDGIVVCKAYVFSTYAGDESFHAPVYQVDENKVEDEIARFEAALVKARTDVRHAQQVLAEKAGLKHAKMFDAQLLVLDDKSFLTRVATQVRKERRNAESVFIEYTTRCMRALSQCDDYFRERSADIRDVTRRVLQHLAGKSLPTLADIVEQVIVVAHDLSPSDTAMMHRDHVVGMVTQVGGPTSHTSIMARALEIPAVVGVPDIASVVEDGSILIVDGVAGVVYMNPTAERIADYTKRNAKYADRKAFLTQLRDMPAVTKDDKRIHLMANIEIPAEARHAMDLGAEGVGLYRTEFFFLNRNDLPTEDEQYEAYSAVVRQCGGKSVTIRTLDLGGDKFVSALRLPREMNPFLGWRAIRMCLEKKEMFQTQLRAILRASVHGPVKIMFPMITTVEEVRLAKQMYQESREQLRQRGVAYTDNIEVGVMIEIPSAALTADVLAREVDFFSIGTNDLIQYTLAIDRVNEKTAHMYDPLNIAVLRLIKRTVDAAHNQLKDYCVQEEKGAPRRAIKVAVCGEMAATPHLAYLLIGLGVDELSTVATAIPTNKEVVRGISFADARQVAEEALRMSSSSDVRALIQRHFH